MKKKCILIAGFVLILVIQARAQVRMTVYGGIGLPKIPTNQISRRTPFSITGGAAVSVPVLKRLLVQAHGNGLYSMDFGSAIDQSSDFRFNMLWAGFDLGYSMRNSPMNRSSILAGIGLYSLSQIWDNNEENVQTIGMSLGLSNMRYKFRHGTLFEIKWHLLFEPDPMPQVLTVTIGYVF